MLHKKLKFFFSVLVLSSMIPTFAGAASYTVTKGDSLYTIGEFFGTSSSQLMRDNGLKSSVIYPGQKLEVPARTYTVQSGDTLYWIAKLYGISIDSLRKANAEWDNMIYVGQKLIVPQGSAAKEMQNLSVSAAPTASTQTVKSEIPYTAAEMDLLARLITAEANNQPYQAKVAVGAVVVNRVQDSRFPGSINGVIYDKANGYYQFTPVLNGMINKSASEEAKKAAYDALHGSDPTKGAVWFFDNTATNKWLWSKPIALRSGAMIFSY